METVTTLNGSIPPTMRAAVYRGINDVRVENVPVPEIAPGEVLVKIHSCGICGTDLKKIHTGSHSAPRIFGHEMAGVIAAVGDKVSGWKVGDRVMAFHHIPCGKGCYYCTKKTFSQCESYKRVGCTAGFEPSGGGFAEYIRVMDWIVERGLVRIPDHVPFEQALWIEPVNTCYKAIHNLHLQADETVLVIGQGPIGILLASLARQTGATVLTSDLYPSRHEVASQFDLRHPIYADK
ncbi:MAG: alcohol dehydrogenase catalytic domain-containing protein, partial [Acidobacteriaceae bacterium]